LWSITSKKQIMGTYLEQEETNREKANAEAKRLLSIMDKKTALFFCEEMAKKLPNINDTPPIHRKPRENYMQFYYNEVRNAINSL
jgi:hypothetical protein